MSEYDRMLIAAEKTAWRRRRRRQLGWLVLLWLGLLAGLLYREYSGFVK